MMHTPPSALRLQLLFKRLSSAGLVLAAAHVVPNRILARM